MEILSGVHSFKEFQNPKNFPDKIRGNDVTKWVKMQYLNRKVLKWLDFVTDVRHLQNTHPVQKLCKNIHLTSFYDVIRDYDVIIGLLISLYINIIRMSVCLSLRLKTYSSSTKIAFEMRFSLNDRKFIPMFPVLRNFKIRKIFRTKSGGWYLNQSDFWPWCETI